MQFCKLMETDRLLTKFKSIRLFYIARNLSNLQLKMKISIAIFKDIVQFKYIV